jgi:hypothetical protein
MASNARGRKSQPLRRQKMQKPRLERKRQRRLPGEKEM